MKRALAHSLVGSAIGALVLGSAAVVGIAAPAAAAPDGTVVGGPISGDQVWTKDAGPYRVTSTVDIAAGASLTVEPGTTIELVQPTFGYGTVFRVGGMLDIDGDVSAPVRLLAPGENGSNTLVEPTNGTTTGVVRIEALEALGEQPVGIVGSDSSANALTSLTVSDSRIRTSQIQLDNATTQVELRRNVILAAPNRGTAQLRIRNPSVDRVLITDNRLRNTELACSGTGRLAAPANTFERAINSYEPYQSARVLSSDDCVLSIPDSYWEADDAELGNRIGGVGRVLYTPTAAAPSADTPTAMPAPHRQNQSLDQFNRPYLDVTPGSDGGLEAKIVAYATNRETNQVEQTVEVDARRWPRPATERLVFDDLTVGGLYQLSSYLENERGQTSTVSSESFVVKVMPPTTTAPRYTRSQSS